MLKEMVILPFQTFYDSRFGKIEHTRRIAEQLKKNFNVLPYPVPIFLSHKSDSGKYGEVRSLKVNDDGLAAEIEFNAEGEALIKSGRYDYLSPAYHENYVDKRTGKGAGETLIEVSLTPTPAQPGMQRIALTETDGDHELITWDVQIDHESQQENTDKGVMRMADNNTDFAVIKRYEEEIAVLKTQTKTFDETLKAQAKQFEEHINEKDAQIKSLSDDLDVIKKEKHVMRVQQWSDGWMGKSKVPALVKMLAEKLIETPEQESFFDSVLEASNGVPTNRIVGLSEAEKAPVGVDIDELAKKLAGAEVR